MKEIKRVLEEEGERLFGKIFPIHDFWEKIGVKNLKENSMPLKISKDILYIAVKHPVWKNEILMNRDLLIEKIQKGTGIKVKDIVVEIARTLPRSTGAGEEMGKNSQKIRDPISEEDLIFILNNVKDPETKKRISLLLNKIHGRRGR